MIQLKTDLAWRQYNGGRRWRTLPSGQIEVEGQGLADTGGQPLTARAFLLEYGAQAHEAARRFSIPVPWIVGMASIEAVRLKSKPKRMEWADDKMARFLAACLPNRGQRLLRALGFDPQRRSALRMDPVSLREEPGYVHPEDTPGRVSAGLMQTLVTTARAMAHKHQLHPLTLEGERREVTLGDLLCPRLSLLYGTAYMAHEMEQAAARIERLTEGGKPARGCDFPLLTGAYNAGAILPDDPKRGNPYGLLTHGAERTDRAIRILNDCHKPGAIELIEPWALTYPASAPR